MKLLISVSFSEEAAEKLMTILESLRKCSRKGMFYNQKDFRMNFILINDVDDDDVRTLQNAVNNFSFSPFKITFNKIDKSRREGGDIYWAVAEANPKLDEIYSSFRNFAADYGYELDDMKFKHRVCLGEHIIARPNFEVEPFEAEIDNVTLVEYTPKRNKDAYQELYKKTFTD